MLVLVNTFSVVDRLYGVVLLCVRLALAHVCIIGIIALDSWTVESLVSTAVGNSVEAGD